MNADQKWKEHKASCNVCLEGKTYDLNCEAGIALYRARLNDPNMVVVLTDKGKRGRA